MSLVAGLAGLFLSGYGMAPDSSGGYEPQPSENTNWFDPSGDADASRPPGSTLSCDGKTVSDELGTYCWTPDSGYEGEKAGGGCVDAVGVSVNEETLTAPEDSTLIFAYGASD